MFRFPLKKFALAALPAILSVSLLAAEPDDNAPISRAEFNQLKAQLNANVRELEESKAQLKRMGQRVEELTKAEASAATSMTPHLSESLTDKLTETVTVRTSGTNSQLTISGGASATFGSTYYRYIEASNWWWWREKEYNVNAFRADFNPILEWKVSDQIKFDGDVDIAFSDEQTRVRLETAQISYRLNDYITFAGGRFADPTNHFAQNLRKDWVNRLPDRPLSADDGVFLPNFQTGAQICGVIPIYGARFKYAAFLGNAPRQENPAISLPDTKLGWGGNLGLELIPGVEFGYGVEQMQWKDNQGYASDALLEDNPLVHSAYLDFVREFKRWGTINFHAQWAWSNVFSFNWDPEGNLTSSSDWNWKWRTWGIYQFLPYYPPSPFAPTTGKANAGYLQLSYRPTQLKCFVRNFEPVARFETLNEGWNFHHSIERWTLGLDYWLADATLLKASYAWTDSAFGRIGDLYQVQIATEF